MTVFADSSALVKLYADDSCTDFAAFDNQLREAAAAEGFRLAP